MKKMRGIKSQTKNRNKDTKAGQMERELIWHYNGIIENKSKQDKVHYKSVGKENFNIEKSM